MATITEYLNNRKNNALPAGYNALSDSAYSDAVKKNNGGFGAGLGYIGEKTWNGLVSWAESTSDAVIGGIASLFGDYDTAKRVFENDWRNYNAADERFNPGTGWKTAGDIFQGVGYSLPSMAIMFGTGGASSALGAGATAAKLIGGTTSFVTSAVGATGNAAKEAMQTTGKLGKDEWKYALLSGATEGAVETFSDMLFGGVGGVANKLGQQMTGKVAKAVARETAFKTIGKAFLSEGGEEIIGGLLEPVWKRMTINPDEEMAWSTPEKRQELLYQGFVGGMSGALMGGVGQVYSSAMAYRAGSKTLTAGKTQEVLDTAKAAVDSTSDSKVRDNIRETLDLYNKEAEKNGDNPSKRQAMLLGELEGTLTQYAFEDTVRESAIKIMQNPEAVVEAVNAWGIKDESGKPIVITAEQIRENSGKNWLKENSLLQRLAILDAAGRLMADTNAYEQALLEGQYLGTRADVANFAQKATPEQKAAVNAELGIDIEKATYEDISKAFAYYLYSGRNEQFAQRVADETELRNAPATDAIDLDSKFALKDGETATYNTENGTVRMSARGDTVYAQDSDGKIRSTTRAEAEKFAQDNAKARDERTAYEKYDARANEEISDYKNLSEPRKVTIREILRQAEAKGVDAKTATLYAKIAARTGLDVTFDEKFKEDGMFDGTNRIVVNPKGSHTRTFSKILIHELDHALTKHSGAKLQNKLIKTAFENMSEDLRLEVAEKYKNFYENNTKLSLSQIIDIINDEETAAYAEQMLTDTGVWDYLLSEKPTLKQKVLSFFTGEAQAYKGTEMSKEARRWWRLYKQAFDKIADNKAFIANAEIISPEEQLFGRRYNLSAVTAHKTKLDKMYLDSKASVDLDTLKQRYDSIVKVWNEIGGELNSEFLEAWNKRDYKNKAFTVFKEQSGYKYNIELSSMCKKGVPLFDAIDTIVKEQAMKDLQIESIDKEQKEILYDVLKSKDYQIPCAICYVEQARQNEGVIIKEFLSGNENGKIGWNSTLTRIEGMMKEAGVDYTFPTLDRSVSSEMYNPNEITMDEKTQDAFYAALKTIANEEIRKANADPSKKTKRKLISVITPASVKESLKGSLTSNLALVKTLFNDPNSRMHIDNDLLYSSFTTSNLAGYHHDLYSLFNRQRGTAGYKTKQQPIVYSGDLLGRWVKNNKGGEINTRIEGGIRYQSNSDSQAYTILDQVQMFIDLSAQGQYLQMYTKVPSSLVLFGKSGAKMNASLIPMVQIYYLDEAKKIVDVEKTRKYAGLSKSGNLLFDDVEGINHNIAFMVASDPEYSKNVGCICIGYSDLHIEKMLDDPRIQQIIGYHDKSNDPKKRYRGAEYAHNYNGENEAVDKNGTTKHIGFNQFVLRAEKMFGYNENTGKANERIKTVEFNGKTYSFNDIPRLAADIYKDYCAKNNYTPAYKQFMDRDNYYKLLADFSLRDSQGNYAPHRKVEYNMPETVPVWNNGKVDTVSSKEYIKSQLREELKVRDSIARDLADTSENGIIPQFKQRVRATSESRSVDAMTGENVRFALREKPDPKKTIKVYKLMRLVDGKLAPLFIDTANPIELGKWYDADSPKLDYIKTLPTGVHLVNDADNTSITLDEFISQNGGKTRTTPTAEMIDYATQNGLRWISIEETERGQRRFGGENRKYWNYGVTENYKNGKTTRSVGLYSMRPGWHAGSLPTMQQIPNTDADRTFVWVEGEMPADINYQAEAERNPDKDIPDHIPTDGYYLKATNANKKAAQADKVGWYVAGAFRPNKIISYAEARNVIDEWNNAHPDAIVDYDFDRLHGKDIDPKTLKIVDVQSDTGVRFALSEASMTEERIDYIIEDSSAGNRTDYAQKWVTSINPTDFLNMTLGLKYQNREMFDQMPGDYGTNVDQYDYTEGLKKNIRQTPYLAVNVDTGEVVGHEGRHRMRALERAGINNSAIVIEFRDSDGYLVKQKNGAGNPLTTIPSITISNQRGTGQTTVLSNIIPAMKSTKAEILSAYGQPDTGVRYAIQESDSSNKYTYESLTKKGNIRVVKLNNVIPTDVNGEIDVKKVVEIGRENAKKQKNPKNTNTSTFVRVDDIGLDVLLSKSGMVHGLPRSRATAYAVMQIGDVLKSSIAVNELNGSTKRNTEMSYVLLGACADNDNLYVVRSLVSKMKNDVTQIDVYQIGAVKGKKTETPTSALGGTAVTEQSSLISSESSEISIADFFNNVKTIPLANEAFSANVAKKLGINRSAGTISNDIRYALSDDEIIENTKSSIRREAPASYKPKLKEKVSNAITNTKIQFINEWAGVEKYAKKAGVKNIDPIIQKARATTTKAQSAMGDVTVDYFKSTAKDQKMTKGFGEIMKPVYAKGDAYTVEFNDYLLNYHNIDRMSLEERSKAKLASLKEEFNDLNEKFKKAQEVKEDPKKIRAMAQQLKALGKTIANFKIEENKPVFGENKDRARAITAEESRRAVAKLEKKHPEFRKLAEEVWYFYNNQQQFRVESGLISAEDKAYFDEKYPHYVPTFRDTTAQGMAPVKGKNNVEFSKTIKTAKGGGEAIKAIELTTGQMIQQTYKAGAYNSVMNALFDAVENGTDVDGIEIVERKKVSAEEQADRDYEAEKPKNNQITFYRNGERITVKVTKEIFAGIDSIQSFSGYDNPIVNFFYGLNKLFKNLVTSLNPAFTIRNKVKDVQDAAINTRHGAKFAENSLTGRGLREIITNGKYWQEYRANGGYASSVFNFDEAKLAKLTKNGLEALPGFTGENTVEKTLNLLVKTGSVAIEDLNVIIEQSTRLNEYIAARESGATVDQAILDAAEVTTNFGRTGKLVKHFNRTIMPFLNASIQGSSKIVRNVIEKKSIASICMLLFRVSFIGMLPQIFNHIAYKDDDDYKELRDNDKANNYLIKVGNDFIKIPKGRVASAMAGAVEQVWHAAKGEQTDVKGYLKNTASQITPVDNVARTIISPFMDVANNKTWYGTAIEGKQFENTAPKDRYDEATSSIAIGLGKVLNYSPKKIHYIIDQYSGVIGDFILPATTKKAERGFISGNFTIDPVSSNRLSTDFYKLYDEAQYAKTAGDETAAYQVQQLNRVKSAISEMFKQKSEIQKRTDLSDKEKLAQTRTIQALINEAYRTAINDFDTYTSAIKSTEGTDEKLRGVEATRLVYGAEAAFKQYNSDVYDKMSTLAATGISYDNLYSFYFGTKDITGDPDGKDGYKMGTKRKNIVSAINKLNVTPQQKLLLIASKGYSLVDGDVKGMTAQTEKRKLLAYINSIRGLTEDQKEALAKMCGYTYKNGRVTM